MQEPPTLLLVGVSRFGNKLDPYGVNFLENSESFNAVKRKTTLENGKEQQECAKVTEGNRSAAGGNNLLSGQLYGRGCPCRHNGMSPAEYFRDLNLLSE